MPSVSPQGNQILDSPSSKTKASLLTKFALTQKYSLSKQQTRILGSPSTKTQKLLITKLSLFHRHKSLFYRVSESCIFPLYSKVLITNVTPILHKILPKQPNPCIQNTKRRMTKMSLVSFFDMHKSISSLVLVSFRGWKKNLACVFTALVLVYFRDVNLLSYVPLLGVSF